MSYTIDFSDPLKATFIINTGDYNGPGGNAANSCLRLYGRSALGWGEAVNENQLRLLEHWASATPPPNPIEGQLWYEQQLYILEAGTAWWRWNFSLQTWDNVTPAVFGGTTGSNIAPGTPADGDYWYTGNSPVLGLESFTLYRYDTQYRQAPSTWLRRSFSVSLTDPNAPLVRPTSQLKVWNGQEWIVSTNITASSTAPTDETIGNLWYDISGAPINVLRVYNGTMWEEVNQELFDQRYVNISGDTMTGNLSLGGNMITDLGTPTNPNDAISLTYADNTYLMLAGGTLTGNISMSNNYITNLLDPVNNQDAATKQYVDTVTAAVTVIPTGVVWDYFGTTAPSGWLLLNGDTIGNTGSGATFTGSQYQSLYTLLWNLPVDTAPVSGGRGASAAADWAANKTLTLPNASQRVFIGGGTPSSHWTEFTNTDVNVATETITLPSNVDKWITGMPITFNVISGTAPSPLVNATTYWIIRVSNTEIQLASSLANAQNQTPIEITSAGSGTFRITYTPNGNRTLGSMGGETEHAMDRNELLRHSHTSTILSGFNVNANPGVQVGSGNTGLTGGNRAMNIMQPYIVTNKIIKI